MIDDATRQAILSAVRALLTAVGAALATRGYINDGTAQEIVGAVMVILPLLWGIWDKYRAEGRAKARELVAVNAGAAAVQAVTMTPAEPLAESPAQARAIIEVFSNGASAGSPSGAGGKYPPMPPTPPYAGFMGSELVWWLAAACIAAVMVVGLVRDARAAPFAVMTNNGIRIVLYDDLCALPAISNLIYRATWTEAGVTTEGCFSPHPMGIALFYFADRTVTVAPMSGFKKVAPA